MLSAEQYAEQLKQLMPRGRLWDDLIAQDAEFSKWLKALAIEYSRIDDRMSKLIDETDPRTMQEMLIEWEDYLDLPDSCIGQVETVQQRRETVQNILTSVGGQSRAYFIGIAESLGFPGATITEYDPYTVDETVDAPIYGAEWAHAWKLGAPAAIVNQFTVESVVDESLGETAPSTRLECVTNKYKPAQTVALFEYT